MQRAVALCRRRVIVLVFAASSAAAPGASAAAGSTGRPLSGSAPGGSASANEAIRLHATQMLARVVAITNHAPMAGPSFARRPMHKARRSSVMLGWQMSEGGVCAASGVGGVEKFYAARRAIRAVLAC